MKYSIDEIDFMRWGVGELYDTQNKPLPWVTYNIGEREKTRAREVEDRIRTYMVGGIEVQEIARKVFSVLKFWPSQYAPFYPVEYQITPSERYVAPLYVEDAE